MSTSERANEPLLGCIHHGIRTASVRGRLGEPRKMRSLPRIRKKPESNSANDIVKEISPPHKKTKVPENQNDNNEPDGSESRKVNFEEEIKANLERSPSTRITIVDLRNCTKITCIPETPTNSDDSEDEDEEINQISEHEIQGKAICNPESPSNSDDSESEDAHGFTLTEQEAPQEKTVCIPESPSNSEVSGHDEKLDSSIIITITKSNPKGKEQFHNVENREVIRFSEGRDCQIVDRLTRIFKTMNLSNHANFEKEIMHFEILNPKGARRVIRLFFEEAKRIQVLSSKLVIWLKFILQRNITEYRKLVLKHSEEALEERNFQKEIIFIGKLFIVGLLPESFMHKCLRVMFEIGDSHNISCICKLLDTVGNFNDLSEGTNYYQILSQLIRRRELPKNIHTMVRDILQLKGYNWDREKLMILHKRIGPTHPYRKRYESKLKSFP